MLIDVKRLHHVAIICSDYEKSKRFYIEVLGFKTLAEVYRKDRQSYKLDLSLSGTCSIELFSFPETPQRPTNPEATGLRHIAFEVDNIEKMVELLHDNNLFVEPVRVDEFTNKKYTFIFDPDNLPIELYEK